MAERAANARIFSIMVFMYRRIEKPTSRFTIYRRTINAVMAKSNDMIYTVTASWNIYFKKQYEIGMFNISMVPTTNW